MDGWMDGILPVLLNRLRVLDLLALFVCLIFWGLVGWSIGVWNGRVDGRGELD